MRSLWIAAVVVAAGGGRLAAAPKPKAAPPKPRALRRPANAPRPAARGAALLAKHLAGAMKGGEEVVFAVRARGQDPHWYANFGHWSADPKRMMYGPGGAQLCRLNLRTRKLTVLVDDPKGSIRDPAVDYDGRKVLFAYRPGGTRHYNLHEMDVPPGGGKPGPMRRVTNGAWDDIEPCYLPNGDIVFCSSRCNRWVQCWHTQVAILHRADANGGGARAISSNVEHDNTPAVLPDGRILYTRWEYIDRSQVDFHHLWTINPDGTAQMTFFGNMHPRMLMIDARAVPPRRGSGRAGSGLVAAIFCPGHGRNEHVGDLMLVNPDAGPDARGWARPVRGCPRAVRDPYPFSETCFLVARRGELLLVDAAAGRNEVIHRLAEPLRRRGLELHEPRALRPRPRELLPPRRADPAQPTGRLILADVTHGRKMGGVRRGEVRKLLVLESLPKPVNFSGGPEPLSYLGTFTLERVLGTVPVEPDGSAYFELPADRPVFFVALDANDLSVKRMHSFTSVMPGETTGCAGCHEPRNETPRLNGQLAALKRPPSTIQPFEGYPDVVDFPRDVQPILDRRCVTCHNFEKRAGGVVLCGDRGPRYSHSFWQLFAHGQVADGRNALGNTAPRAVGSAASPLLRKIDGSHHDVKLSPRERRMVWLWIESGATYSGTYASLGSGATGVGLWGAGGAMQRRCGQCHYVPQKGKRPPKGMIALPAGPHPRRPGGAPHERWIGKYKPAATRSMHALANLTRPERSPVLLAALARRAGGWAELKPNPLDKDGSHSIVFESTRDPDYRRLLAAIRAGKQRLDQVKRFDMPGFRPNEHYVREMKRYGILPTSYNPARHPIDVYETDQAYWRSFWYTPAGRVTSSRLPRARP